jgi:epoxyqueuosine reductase
MGELIRDEIRRFVLESPANLRHNGEGRFFDEPLVGFAAADDPLFADYKEIIGTFHLTPQELMANAFSADEGRAATVICWLLPIVRETRESNRRERQWPSRQWAETRSFGEAFNVALRRHLVGWLAGRGQRALAPQLAAE